MRFPFNAKILPWLSLGFGIVGLALRIWLLVSGVDQMGLLETWHPANILVLIFTVIFLALLATSVQPLTTMDKYGKLFPASPRRALGVALGGIGICYSLFMHGPVRGFLSVLLLLLGLLAVAAQAGVVLCRLKGMRPNFLLPAAITTYMILHTVELCRSWNSVPQVQSFFFPLMTCVFLLMTCYQHSLLNLQRGSRRQYVFYSQAAVFFCLLSATGHTFFYLCMAGWLALDMCSLKVPRIGKFLKENRP